MPAKSRKGPHEFERLNRRFGVKVLRHSNDYGLVHIGYFATFNRAEEYVGNVSNIDGVFLPEDYSPLWPPRESKPEYQYMNERREAKGDICVTIRVPTLAQRE